MVPSGTCASIQVHAGPVAGGPAAPTAVLVVRALVVVARLGHTGSLRSTRAYLVRLSRMHTTPGKVEGQIRNALKDLPDLKPSHQPRRQSPPLRKVEPEMKFLWPPRKDPEA